MNLLLQTDRCCLVFSYVGAESFQTEQTSGGSVSAHRKEELLVPVLKLIQNLPQWNSLITHVQLSCSSTSIPQM